MIKTPLIGITKQKKFPDYSRHLRPKASQPFAAMLSSAKNKKNTELRKSKKCLQNDNVIGLDAIRKRLLDLTHARAWPSLPPLNERSDGPKWGEIAGKLMETDLTMLFNQLQKIKIGAYWRQRSVRHLTEI
jgi:hypothetical protein